jgi:hypothetical protein
MTGDRTAGCRKLRNSQGRRWNNAVWAAASLLWVLPIVAMQFTKKMAWDETDFIVWGVMLVAACAAYELATRMTRNGAYRAAVGLAVLAAFMLIWINLAVGIIGSEDNPANLMYGGVLALGVGGAIVTRCRPRGMARVLVGMACAQALTAIVALSLGLGSNGANWPQVIIVLNGFFAILWLGSAALFWRAARDISFDTKAT